MEKEDSNLNNYFSNDGYISISNDMNVLVTGGEDKTVKIWTREWEIYIILKSKI